MEFSASKVNDRTRQRVTVSAEILDARLRPVPYRRDGRQWQPRTIRITWERTRNGDGEWSAWAPWNGATVTGPHIRKDGSDAQVDTNLPHVRHDDPEFGEWILASRPVGDTTGGA